MEQMNPLNQQLSKRLMELEIKASYTEDALEQLDAVVVRQQEQIETLIRELVLIKQSSADRDMAAPRHLRDELPPHF